MRKKVISMLLCIPLAFSIVGTSASAAAIDEGISIGPHYTYLDLITPSLSISGRTATASGSIRGYSNVTKIEYTVYLQEKNGSKWSDVDSWDGSKNGTNASYSFSKSSLASRKTYRTKTVATIYSGSKSETVTAYSTEKRA